MILLYEYPIVYAFSKVYIQCNYAPEILLLNELTRTISGPVKFTSHPCNSNTVPR